MNGIDAIRKATNFTSLFQHQFGPALSVARMIDSFRPLRHGAGLMNMQHGILKGLGIARNISFHGTLTGQLAGASIAKAMKIPLPTALNFPAKTFETINSIAFRHNQLFESLTRVVDVYKPLYAFAHLSNLKFVLNGLAGEIALTAAAGRQWELFEDFEKVSEHIMAVTETAEPQVGNREDVSVLIKGIADYVYTLFQKNKRFAARVYLFVEAVLVFMAVHQYYAFLTVQPETALKQDLNEIHAGIDSIRTDQRSFRSDLNNLKDGITRAIIDTLRAEGKLRTAARECKVFLKPNTRSITIATLPIDCEITVLQQKHKWMYVSFFNPSDDLPQTGWMQKKYLHRSSNP